MATIKNNTNQFVPIKGITNGMIILDNNLKVTGVKIMPRNIFILDYDSQVATINNLRNVYNTIDYEFWLICADRPVDINLYLSQLQLLYNNVQSQIKRKLILEDIESFMNELGNSFSFIGSEYKIRIDNFALECAYKKEEKEYEVFL